MMGLAKAERADHCLNVSPRLVEDAAEHAERFRIYVAQPSTWKGERARIGEGMPVTHSPHRHSGFREHARASTSNLLFPIAWDHKPLSTLTNRAYDYQGGSSGPGAGNIPYACLPLSLVFLTWLAGSGRPPRRLGRRRPSSITGADNLSDSSANNTQRALPCIVGPYRMLKEGPAAGDGYRCAGYVARKRVSEHDVGGREFRWLASTLHRRILSELGDGFLGKRRGDERRPDWTGRDRIGANAFLGEQLSKSRREIVNGALGRCVGEESRIRRV